MDAVRAAIRTVPDFPHDGILFYDITPVLQDPALFTRVIEAFADRYRPMRIDKVLAMESRGFIFATPLATAIGAGFVPLRKPGKLPYKTHSESFELEYGSESLEIHSDAVSEGERVLIVDDLLATGGTAEASVKLARRTGGVVVEMAFFVELAFLGGRGKLEGTPVHSMIIFD
jgi:adenine phosphoribosyltransferase